MKKVEQYCILVVILVLILGIGTTTNGIIIGYDQYERSGASEEVTATFTTADGGVTTGTYTGYVELSVSGVGQSYSTSWNDAFYRYTDIPGNPITPIHQDTHNLDQLLVSTSVLGPQYAGYAAKNFIVYDLDADVEVTPVYVPAYQSNHIYNFVIDLGTITPSQLHFGVNDAYFPDNTGEYIISVYQLVLSDHLSGLVWMDGSSDFGYSLDEGDLLYFSSSAPVLYYNITTGEWGIEGPVGWVYVDWPFYYELDTDTLMFSLPPKSGLWIYHFSTGEWEVLY